MKGLVIWAYSDCRSVMATYRALMAAANCPTLLVLLHGDADHCGLDLRIQTGFREDEFSDVPREYIELNFEKGRQIIATHPGWNHLFSDYQRQDVVRQLIAEAKSRGEHVGIINEAPCNMASGRRWWLKEVFFRTVLPRKIRSAVRAADFFANCSGDDVKAQKVAGWTTEKIVPFGYFPPPIEGARCVLRTTNKPFHILATGILSRYRGADCLVEALRILKSWGVPYRATITQDGELLPILKAKAERCGLPIDFAGFVQLADLIKLYETCTVYVGAGRDEPWGMRLNDALNCGAPLIVSSGMGGRKLVDDYGCGLVFERRRPADLARQLKALATDEELYSACARRAVDAARKIAPASQAAWLLSSIRKYEGWR